MRKERMMPVQGSGTRPRGYIPESVARLAYRDYGRRYGQSFEMLHQRGGFEWGEIVAGLRGDQSPDGCKQAGLDLLAESEATR